MLKLENVGKIYSTGDNLSVGIRRVNIEFNIGEFVAITGESGSGKSTLLNILSGIDSYEEGEMYVSGEETSYFTPEDLEEYRNKYVGFIFQNYNIIDSYTVLENVEAALLALPLSKEERRKKALSLIDRVGLSKRTHTKASKLSGGEKQRVVIARALSKDPPIIAADEPTGNLDSKSSKEIIDLLHEVSENKLVLIVTHDFNEVADYATRIVRIYDGEVKEDRELKETKKDNLPNLLDTPKTKVSFKDNISLAIKDLFSSPKRSIFYLIVFLFLSVIITFSIAFYRYLELGETYSNLGSLSSFRYQDQRRIVINKKDKSRFTQDEINLLNTSDVKFMINDDYFIDTYQNYYFENPYRSDDYIVSSVNYQTMPIKAITESELTIGRLPENDNEVVISVNENSFNYGYDTKEDFLNKKIEDNMYGEVYTIVGVVDISNTKYVPTIYHTDSKYEEKSFSYYQTSYLDIKYTKDGVSTDNIFYITSEQLFMKDSTLSDDEFSIASYKESYIFSYYTNDSLYHFTFSDFYGDALTLDLKYKENPDYKLEDNMKNKAFSYMAKENVYYLSENNFNKLINTYKNPNQVSIFLKNTFNMNSYKREIDGDKYNYVIPTELSINIEGLDKIASAIYITLVGMFLFGIFFLTYAILLRSVRSRKEDVEVLRTIGIKKENITILFASEMIASATIAFFITTIIFIIIKLSIKDAFIKDVLNAINWFDFVIIYLVLFIMSVLLNMLFSKNAFKKTVKKSLEEK